MSDYLGHLLERSFTPTPEVKPQLRSLFEPKPPAEQAELTVEPPERTPQRPVENSERSSLAKSSNERPTATFGEDPGDYPATKIASAETKLKPVEKSPPEIINSGESIRQTESAKSVLQPNLPTTSTAPRPVRPTNEKKILNPMPVETWTAKETPEPTGHQNTAIASKATTKVVVDFHIDDPLRRYGDRRPPQEKPILQPRAVLATPADTSAARPTKPSVTPPLSVNSSSAKNNGREESDLQTAPAIPPSINVTIGRVEIRATPPPAPMVRPAPRKESGMSLETYLQRRSGGSS